MRFHISKTFTMSCAHQLRLVPEGHKCARLHGHTYHVTVHLSGAALAKDGMLADFGLIKESVHGMFDHQNINEVFAKLGLQTVESTAENLCSVIWDLLEADVIREANDGEEHANWVRVEKISVREGEGGSAWVERD